MIFLYSPSSGMARMASKTCFFGRFGSCVFMILTLMLSLNLSGCGFHPMHGQFGQDVVKNSPVYQSMKIDIIPDRSGQILRNDLMDRLYVYGEPTAPLYTLTIAPIKESSRDLAITKSSEATRAQLWLTTTMTLKNNSGEVLLTRDLRSTASYNTLESEFATRVTEKSARESALGDLARQAELNLTLYFNQKS